MKSKTIHYVEDSLSLYTKCGWYIEARSNIRHTIEKKEVTCKRCQASLARPGSQVPPAKTFRCTSCYNRYVVSLKAQREGKVMCKSCGEDE